jgi:hypothetical protein
MPWRTASLLCAALPEALPAVAARIERSCPGVSYAAGVASAP